MSLIMKTTQLSTHVFVEITHGEILEMFMNVNWGMFIRVAVLEAGIAGLLAGSLPLDYGRLVNKNKEEYLC